MEQPRGFEDKAHTRYVCLLKKALYRFKKASRACYGKIAEFITRSGYKVAPADSILFIKEEAASSGAGIRG